MSFSGEAPNFNNCESNCCKIVQKIHILHGLIVQQPKDVHMFYDLVLILLKKWIPKHSNLIQYFYMVFQVYIQHLRNKQPDRPRKLLLAMKYKEHKKFTKCFHGWGKYKEVKE